MKPMLSMPLVTLGNNFALSLQGTNYRQDGN